MVKHIVCLVLILGTSIITGCTTAGPYVTNISSDGQGNIIVEKSRVKLNSFTGTISNVGGTTTKIKILPEDKVE